MIDVLGQSYRWSYAECIKLSMPQMIMLNHASGVNRARMDARIKVKRATGQQSLEEHVADMPAYKGKRLDELTSEEYEQYMGAASIGGAVKRIKRNHGE